jgi:tetratricopeptide (TPR) repeat protein
LVRKSAAGAPFSARRWSQVVVADIVAYFAPRAARRARFDGRFRLAYNQPQAEWTSRCKEPLVSREGTPDPREAAAPPLAAGERAAGAGEDEIAAPPAPRDPPEAFGDLFERGVSILEEELGKADGGTGDLAARREALDLLERAWALRPDDPDVLYALGVACGMRAMALLRGPELGLAGRTGAESSLQRAIFAFSRAVEIDPKRSDALNTLATLHAMRGDRELAIEALRRSLQVRPDQPDVRERLEELGAF